MRIFFPDIHLISAERQQEAGFQYGTNHTALLRQVLVDLKRMRKQAVAAQKTVGVYVLGDLLDLWREASGFDGGNDAAATIRDSHEDLIEALLDRGLKTHFLLGNHDFALYRLPAYTAWERRYYLPDTALKPRAILLHGDVFDWIESLPDTLEQILVYLFAPNAPPDDHKLGQMEELTKKAHAGQNYQNHLQAGAPLHLGMLQKLAQGAIPPRWNVQTPDQSPPELLKHLDSASEETAKRNQQFGMNLCMVVMGHTHYARIALKEGPEDFFALVDCGAWIESCTWEEGGKSITAPSAQVAALSKNEVRIYQLAPKSSPK